MIFKIDSIEVRYKDTMLTVWDLKDQPVKLPPEYRPHVPEVCYIRAEDDYRAYTGSLPNTLSTGKLKNGMTGKEIALTPDEMEWLYLVAKFEKQFGYEVDVDIV